MSTFCNIYAWRIRVKCVVFARRIGEIVNMFQLSKVVRTGRLFAYSGRRILQKKAVYVRAGRNRVAGLRKMNRHGAKITHFPLEILA